MVDPDRDEIRAWLRHLLEHRKETPTALARRAGVAQSTLTRFLNNADAPMLGLRTIAKIAHAAGVPPIGTPAPQRIAAEFAEEDGKPYIASGNARIALAVTAFIGERPAVDPWEIRTHVLEDIGIVPRDIVVVSLSEHAKINDVVCAQRYRWREGLAETIFRIYEPPYLVAASRDARTRRPLLVDNERVIIKGVVIASFRDLL